MDCSFAVVKNKFTLISLAYIQHPCIYKQIRLHNLFILFQPEETIDNLYQLLQPGNYEGDCPVIPESELSLNLGEITLEDLLADSLEGSDPSPQESTESSQ